MPDSNLLPLDRLPPEKIEWDLSYIASVLAELVGRQRGCQIEFRMVPEPPEATPPGG